MTSKVKKMIGLGVAGVLCPLLVYAFVASGPNRVTDLDFDTGSADTLWGGESWTQVDLHATLVPGESYVVWNPKSKRPIENDFRVEAPTTWHTFAAKMRGVLRPDENVRIYKARRIPLSTVAAMFTGQIWRIEPAEAFLFPAERDTITTWVSIRGRIVRTSTSVWRW